MAGVLIAAPQACAFIYWSSYDQHKSTIGRANLDGGDFQPSIVSGIYYGESVAADGSAVYWSSSGGGAPPYGSAQIGRANADGSAPNPFFRDIGWPQALSELKVLDGQLFWLKGGYMGAGGLEIARAPVAGGSPALVGTGKGIWGFDVEGGFAYWSEGEYIVRAALSNPTAPDRTWLHVGGGLKPAAVAVEGDHVYWTEIEPTSYAGYPWEGTYGTSIGRAPIAEPSAVVRGLVKGLRVRLVSGLDVEGEFIYWTNVADPTLPYPQNIPGYVGRATVGGSEVSTKFLGPLSATNEPRKLDVSDAPPVTPPPFTPGPPGPIPPPTYRGAPTSSNRTFSAGGASTPVRMLASISKKVPKGTVFSYALDGRAAMKIEIKRRKAGRLVGGKCKRTSKANAKRKKCDLVEHTLFRTAKTGVNKVPYTGRVKGKLLEPGKHKAVFTATNAGGSSTATVGFTVVK